MYVLIHVTPHKIFKRKGADIYTEAEISFAEASLGTTIEVPTLDGKAKLKIPAGTQPDTILRLRGQGMPRTRWRGNGDQLVRIKVEVPKKLSRKQRELVEQLSEELDGK